jgi:putative tryptophan/tyrosine transport system substrate-binding protein
VHRRAFVRTLALGLLAAPLAAGAQQAEKVWRIGLLSPESLQPGLLEEFRDELRKLGYVEGKNVVIEVRHAEGKTERLPALADELVQRRVDVILAVNTSAVQAAKKATTTIPIVMTRVADPVRTGLVSSIARPGGNITGVSFMIEELAVKRLQLLKEIIPSISRVALLWYTGNLGGAAIAKELEVASAELGIHLLRLPVQGPGDFPRAVEAASRDRAEALLLVDDAVITRHRGPIVNLAAKHRLPVTSQYKAVTEAGGLIAYGSSTAPMHRRAAQYVDKILKGAKPADLPVEQPTEFELVINMKTAKALGLTIPPSLLQRADQVIE